MKADFTTIKEINAIKAKRNYHAFMATLLDRKLRRIQTRNLIARTERELRN